MHVDFKHVLSISPNIQHHAKPYGEWLVCCPLKQQVKTVTENSFLPIQRFCPHQIRWEGNFLIHQSTFGY